MDTRSPHGIVIVDKPRGRSSHDVVRVARRAFRTRRVGHAGTLDPMATGVLVLGVGEGTKLLRYLGGDDKVYRATVRLGVETDSLDADGRVVATDANAKAPTLLEVQDAARAFVGESLQRAPAISAIKQAGVALHERVRRGEDVSPPERLVLVHALEIEGVRQFEVDLRVHSGKGFYVRSLARDLSSALGTVGHLVALRRIASGKFSLDVAQPYSLLERAAAPGSMRESLDVELLLPLARGLPGAVQLVLDDAGVTDARHGRPIALANTDASTPPVDGTEPILLLDAARNPIALARAQGGRLEVVRGLRVT